MTRNSSYNVTRICDNLQQFLSRPLPPVPFWISPVPALLRDGRNTTTTIIWCVIRGPKNEKWGPRDKPKNGRGRGWVVLYPPPPSRIFLQEKGIFFCSKAHFSYILPKEECIFCRKIHFSLGKPLFSAVYSGCSRIMSGSLFLEALSRPISHPNTGGSPQPPCSKPLGGLNRTIVVL